MGEQLLHDGPTPDAHPMTHQHPTTTDGRGADSGGRAPGTGACTVALRLSVVIPNYNYAEFVGQAIDSALAIDWPDVEVIVVDDGSTDDSHTVIARYGRRITVVLQANAGQYMAYNAGFAQATGDVIIFLDSDDLLEPTVMREVARAWRPGLSKVQFRMQTVDRMGRLLGGSFPQFQVAPSPQLVRQWVLNTTAYPTPPGSGNAYAAEFLARILPLDLSCGKPGDACCVAASPLMGDVLTLDKPLARYRVHGRNDGAVSQLDPKQMTLHVERTLQRHPYAMRIAAQAGLKFADGALNRSLSYLPYRLASLRLAPQQHPITGDSRMVVLRDALRAVRHPQGLGWTGRAVLLAWVSAVALAPQALAERLILWRFAPAARPKALGSVLRMLHVLR